MSSSNTSPTATLTTPPPPTQHQLKSCQFSSWYSTFRNLHKHPPHPPNDPNDDDDDPKRTKTRTYPFNNVTIRSIIIKPLPLEFIKYLQSDGVVLPLGAEKVSSFLPTTTETDYDCDWSSDEGEDDGGNDNDNDDSNDNTANDNKNNNKQYHFPQLNEQIKNALERLGPSIPKLNWSCPKDVSWINGETLKCSEVGDIYLLLQSSDFCMFDLTHALEDVVIEEDTSNDTNVDADIHHSQSKTTAAAATIEYELILRKWSNLHPSMEFRCFVSNHEIVAISQRNHTQHFPHLKKDYMIIRSHIIDFFISTIQYTYAYSDANANANGDTNGDTNNDNDSTNDNPNDTTNAEKGPTICNYVFDVYVDKNDRVWLIDFNLWAERTDPLLFKWDELMQMQMQMQMQIQMGGRVNEEGNENDVNDVNDVVIDIHNSKPEMRVVMNQNEILCDPLSSYRAPIDTVDLASDTVGSHSFQEFMAMCQLPSTMNDSDDDTSTTCS